MMLNPALLNDETDRNSECQNDRNGPTPSQAVDLGEKNDRSQDVQREHQQQDLAADPPEALHLLHPDGVAHEPVGQNPLLERRAAADEQQEEGAQHHESQVHPRS